jgi:hypothetical protein
MWHVDKCGEGRMKCQLAEELKAEEKQPPHTFHYLLL